jgi:mitochondrial splicing suppressor protein 51
MASSNIMQREALMRRNNCEIPNMPLLARRGYLCFRCWQPADKMTKCAGCRRVFYCSKSCQKLDWELQHKRHCKILRHINGLEEKETAKSRSWELYQESLYFKLKEIQGVSPEALPRETVQGQPYCSSCHRSVIQAATMTTSLTPCDACHMVFTCGDCKPSHPKSQCLEYQSWNEVEQFRIDHFEQSGQAQCQAPMNTPRSEYKALSTASHWVEYFANISDKDFLRLFADQDVNLLKLQDLTFSPGLDGSKRLDAKRLLMYHLLATDTLTMFVSIVAALEDSAQELITKETISVHLVGAAGKEFHSLAMFEEMLHLLPSLKHLRVTLIGTGNDQGDGQVNHEVPCNCCPTCTKSGRRRTAALYKGLYHEYVKSDLYRKPDIAVLFHSGRTQEAEASWRPTTRFLVDSATLTLCTTYNKGEAMEEAAELESLRARFIVRPEVNKWKSLLPLPDLMDGPEHGVYYHNYFRYIFQGRV